MKVLITGGAGFLGYHLANYLNRKSCRVSLLDIAPFETTDYPENSIFYNTDIRDFDNLLRAVKGTDLVVHAAAALPLWSKKDIYTTNIDGTRNVLEASLKWGIKKVIFISSTAVYGVPKKHPILEDDPLVGVGPYGESKITAEEICRKYRGKGLSVPIIRPKTFLGPGRLGVFQILYDWVKNGKRIPILGRGENRYQLLAVEDLCESIYQIAAAPDQKVNDAFNVAAEEFRTVREDVGELCRFAGSGARVFSVPAGPAKLILRILETARLSPLYKWVYETADKDSYVSIGKIKTLTDFKPKFSNSQTLISSYQWYLDNFHNTQGRSGITHRVAWKQGIFGIFKKLA